MVGRETWIRDSLAKPLLKGAVSGCVATGPMTGAMLVAHRLLPWQHQTSLPPKKLAMTMAARFGIKQHLDGSQRQMVTWVSHFGYGSAAGAAYGPIAQQVSFPPMLIGMAYGLVVWAGSYAGLLPVMNMPEVAKDQPWERNLLMIGAHLVWGSVLGLAVEYLPPRKANTA